MPSARPDLIEAWQHWSEDKRVPEGGYLQLGTRSEVGYYPSGEPMEFGSSLEACTEFVLREIFDLLSLDR